MPEEMEEEVSAGVKVTSFVLPIATAGMALLVGVTLGGILGWVLNSEPPEVVEVPRDLTPEELVAACAPLVQEVAENLEEAQEKVDNLQGKVTAKEAQVVEMEAEMARRYQRGVALVTERDQLKEELEAAKAELATLKVALEQAIEEKEQLVIELKSTQEQLEVKTEEARVSREISLDNRWATFQSRAQLEICDKGRRKKMGKCREKIVEVLGPAMEAKFKHCIRSGQSVASIHEFDKREEERLPEFASWLDQDDRITKDWYILLCDPTLPEAEDLGAVEHLLEVNEWSHLDGTLDGDDDLEIEDLDSEEGGTIDVDDIDLEELPEGE